MAKTPPEGVNKEQDTALRQIVSTWSDEVGKGTLTLANRAILIFDEIGWLFKRLLPNNAVGALSRPAVPRAQTREEMVDRSQHTVQYSRSTVIDLVSINVDTVVR